jgi:hypothetical protein
VSRIRGMCQVAQTRPLNAKARLRPNDKSLRIGKLREHGSAVLPPQKKLRGLPAGCQVVGWVATPHLGGRAGSGPAPLRGGLSCHVTWVVYTLERSQRITHMDYLSNRSCWPHAEGISSEAVHVSASSTSGSWPTVAEKWAFKALSVRTVDEEVSAAYGLSEIPSFPKSSAETPHPAPP